MKQRVQELSSFFKQENQKIIYSEDIIEQKIKRVKEISKATKIELKKTQIQIEQEQQLCYLVDTKETPFYLNFIEEINKLTQQEIDIKYPWIELQNYSQEQKQKLLPYFLTEKEKKRLKRMNKIKKQELKKEQILLGNIPKPLPRATLKNMQKVFPQEAQSDPTRLEVKVKKQIKERLNKHIMHNQITKLNKEQKYEKRIRKIKRDMQKGLFVYYYQIDGFVDYKSSQNILKFAQKFFISGRLFIPKESLQQNKCYLIIDSGLKYSQRFAQRIKTILQKQIEKAELKDCIWSEQIQEHKYKQFSIQ